MRIAQLEADLRRKKTEVQALLEDTMRRCQEHVVQPAAEGRPAVTGREMSAEERGRIDAMMEEARGIRAQLDRAQGDASRLADIDRLTEGLATQPTARPATTPQEPARLSIGQQFVADEGFRRFIANGGHRRAGAWTSPLVELSDSRYPGLRAATLTSDPASGGALIVPEYVPGLVALPVRRTVVADLIAPGTTTSNVISYMKEKTFTNAAAPVAEAGLKPESALIFEAATAPVRKIAHWIPVSEEMLEDSAQVASVIDARLRTGIELAEEDQLLNGNGTAPNLLGFNNLTGLAPDQIVATDSNADAIFKQITHIATTAFMTPTGVVMNPADWADIQLTKNAQGNYMGTGPWAAPQNPTIWGISVASTPAQLVSQALVGAFATASQLFRKGGIRVEASNSHADFFIKNLVAIRAEERIALAVYREGAFGKVIGLGMQPPPTTLSANRK